MADLRWAALDRADLPAMAGLLHVCFPEARKFSPEFLEWQYFANPVGPPQGWNVFSDERLVGHLAAIPQPYRLRGKDVQVSLLLNVAIDPSLRGGGLFQKLVRRTCDEAAEKGAAAVIGVANQRVIKIYEARLGFQNVAGLAAWGEWIPAALEAGRAAAAHFAHRWDEAALAWRMANPANPLRIASAGAGALRIEGGSTLPLVAARAIIPRGELSISRKCGLAGPAVVLGLAPAGALRRSISLDVPERLRPSPLRLIYKNLAEPGDRLDPDRVLFSFLDFDAF